MLKKYIILFFTIKLIKIHPIFKFYQIIKWNVIFSNKKNLIMLFFSNDKKSFA